MITHVLDTSAILAHYLDEPGASQVDDLFANTAFTPAVSAATLVELRERLHDLIGDPAEAARAFDVYANELATVLSVSPEIAQLAVKLESASGFRLGPTSAIAAATAAKHNAQLVHSAAHFAALPAEAVTQLLLPTALSQKPRVE